MQKNKYSLNQAGLMCGCVCIIGIITGYAYSSIIIHLVSKIFVIILTIAFILSVLLAPRKNSIKIKCISEDEFGGSSRYSTIKVSEEHIQQIAKEFSKYKQ